MGVRRSAAGIPGLGDKNMMLEMQLKMAKRAEKASRPTRSNSSGSSLGRRLALQCWASDDLGVDLANSLASGSFFAARRAAGNARVKNTRCETVSLARTTVKC